MDLESGGNGSPRSAFRAPGERDDDEARQGGHRAVLILLRPPSRFKLAGEREGPGGAKLLPARCLIVEPGGVGAGDGVPRRRGAAARIAPRPAVPWMPGLLKEAGHPAQEAPARRAAGPGCVPLRMAFALPCGRGAGEE